MGHVACKGTKEMNAVHYFRICNGRGQKRSFERTYVDKIETGLAEVLLSHEVRHSDPC